MKNAALILLLFCFCNGYAVSKYPTTADIFVYHDTTNVFREVMIRQFMSNCERDITLINIELNSQYLYWASNTINVRDNYRITANSGADIRMKAGKYIVLKPSTTILKGNHYLARIEACESPCTAPESFSVPKGISPNNDDLNDSFDLTGLCVTNVQVFNRYGVVVYEAQNYTDEWHGQSDKGNLPTGTYYYRLDIVSGEQLTGWVYLQRE